MLVTPGISTLEDVISAFALLIIHTNVLLIKYVQLTIDPPASYYSIAMPYSWILLTYVISMEYFFPCSFKASLIRTDCPVGEDKSFFSGMQGFMGYKFIILRSACFSREGCTIEVEIARITSMSASEYLIGNIVPLQEGI